ncbi:hypothetical protein [Streptomyces rhizosphaericola]
MPYASRCRTGPLPLGERLRVRLTRAGPEARTVLFAPA